MLRRSAAGLEIIVNGVFLVSAANAVSSRALVTAAWPHVRAATGLEVLIGGLGLGYALDEALASERVAHVTVAEYEPAIVRWFRAYGEGRAERAAAGERAGRATIEVADVADAVARVARRLGPRRARHRQRPRVAGARRERRPVRRPPALQRARRALRPGRRRGVLVAGTLPRPSPRR